MQVDGFNFEPFSQFPLFIRRQRQVPSSLAVGKSSAYPYAMARKSGNSKAGGLRASRVRRDRYRKKYVDLLRASDEESLCRQVWAVSLLQEGKVKLAARRLAIPQEALGARLDGAC